MESSVDCVIRLGKISLRPEVLSPPEYIDLLIDGEKSEAKSGWKKRVQYLINIRGKAEEDDDDEESHFINKDVDNVIFPLHPNAIII